MEQNNVTVTLCIFFFIFSDYWTFRFLCFMDHCNASMLLL